MAVGKRIYLKRHMPDPEVMMQFKTIPASNTCDVMGRNAAMNPRIKLVSSPKDQMMVGPALTVKARGGDNLALHAALNMAQEGDVLVVSNEGDNTRALMGEIMMAYLRYTKKVAGIVLDGPIRDIDEIADLKFPVYLGSTSPVKSARFMETVDTDVPVFIGGVQICPEDLILMDRTGVAVVPSAHLKEVLEEAKKIKAKEDRIEDLVRVGMSLNEARQQK